MSLDDHLEELRYRLILALAGLIVAMVISLFFGRYIVAFIEKPYIRVMGEDARFQILAPAAGFTAYMELAMIAGIVLSSPWIFYQLWMFISAGLYPDEKHYVNIAAPFCAVLFITGALFFLFMIAPVTLKFLVMCNKKLLGAESNFTFNEYMSFINMMMLIFGLAFQTPIAIFFLIKTGLVSIETFINSRKFVILAIVIIAAAVIPGSDIFSLFGLAVPLYLLFELGILMGVSAERKAQKKM
ncbi:MAG: twin-arginine translocase subunit TatC [Phycisphaerae bacterium]|nr:twin-arginine translocase subunit TatC [Phycisphaerae bacterium]